MASVTGEDQESSVNEGEEEQEVTCTERPQKIRDRWLEDLVRCYPRIPLSFRPTLGRFMLGAVSFLCGITSACLKIVL